jgi:hypothetical protein
LNAVVSLSSYEGGFLLLAMHLRRVEQKEKIDREGDGEGDGNGRRERERAQVNGLRVHVVGVVYLGYTRVILSFAAGVTLGAFEGLLCIRVMGLRPVSFIPVLVS